MTCYGSNMTNRRGLTPAPETPTETTAGRLEVAADMRRDSGDVSVRDFLAAGGRRGFTAEEMYA